MQGFWDIANHFPTAIFTTINLILIGYWLLVAIGLFDFDFFDLDVDGEIDGSELSGFAAFLATFGLTGVPVTIVFTVLMFVSWILSYTAVKLGLFWTTSDWIVYLVGTGILVGSFLFALPITAQLIKPLRKLFAKLYGDNGNKNLLGRPCKIRSSRVDNHFGEAECSVHGASLMIKVRAEEKFNFKKGDVAYIIDVDPDKSIYFVVDEFTFNKSSD